MACATDPIATLTCHERIPDYLRRLYLFGDLEDHRLEALAATARSVELDDGEWLFRQGEEARSCYVVRSGEIALFLLSREGKESVVTLVGADEMFAEELVSLEQANHDINAQAVGPCTVLALDRSELRSLLLETPELALRLLSTLHRRQRILIEHVQCLTLRDATDRVLHYLLQQAGKDGTHKIRLRVPKKTLASHLSIQPETLSRVLKRLKAHDHVGEEGESLVVDTRRLSQALGCESCSARFWGCPGPEQRNRWFEATRARLEAAAHSLPG
jgi:CRP-like cAMP-binding protein